MPLGQYGLLTIALRALVHMTLYKKFLLTGVHNYNC